MSDQPEIHILLVDDVPANLRALEAILADLDVVLVKATSGQAALKELLADREFAAVLLDVQMPVLDGFETAAMIRERERLRHLPIIFLTAYHQTDEHLFRGYALGAVDYIFKPIVPEILRSKVAVLADLFRMRKRDLMMRDQETVRLREHFLRRERELERERVLFFSLTADLLLISDFGGAIKQLNPAFTSLLGDLKGQSFYDFIYPEDRPGVRERLDELGRGSEHVLFECRCVAADRTARWISWNAAAFQDEGVFFAVGRDVTDRKAADYELASLRDELSHQLVDMTRLHELSTRLTGSLELETLLGETLQAATGLAGAGKGMILMLDAETNDLVLKSHVGFEEEFVRRSSRIPVGTRVPGRCARDLRRILVTDTEADEEMREIGAIGGFRSVFATPLLTREGKLLGVFCTHFAEARVPTDREIRLVELYAHQAAQVIESARLFHQAQEAIRIREEFLSIASHELKTPLTALQLHLQRMLITMRGKTEFANLRDMVEDARRQGDRLAKLINNLLDVSRLTAGKLSLYRETVDLASAARAVAERFGPELEQRKITISVQAPDAVQGHWDRLRVEQVITNLISNAIQYGNGHPIEVTVRGQGDHALLTVKDGGIGISQEAMERLFHPFERFSSSRHFGGLGLGLYIVRQIVQAHAGRIRVESRVNEGSTFLVELPILRPAEVSASR